MREARVLLALGVLVLLPGCYEIKERWTLRLDGGGDVWIRTREDPNASAALRRAAIDFWAPGGTQAPLQDDSRMLPDPAHPSWVQRALRGSEGARVWKAKRRTVKGVPSSDVLVRFDALSEGARAGTLWSTSVELRRTEEGTWALTLRPVLPAHARRSWDEATCKARGASLGAALAGWRLERTIRFPTKVLATNGELGSNGLDVTWTLTGAQLLGDPSALDMRAELSHDEDLLWRPIRHTPDEHAIARRLFDRPPPLEAVEPD